MLTVEKDTNIAEIITHAPETIPLFQEIGMHCMGCALASGESVEEACQVHGVDVDNFIARLNAAIADR